MRLDRAAKGLFLLEFVTGFVLGMRYFFRPKATINYPYEKNPISPRFRGEHHLGKRNVKHTRVKRPALCRPFLPRQDSAQRCGRTRWA